MMFRVIGLMTTTSNARKYMIEAEQDNKPTEGTWSNSYVSSDHAVISTIHHCSCHASELLQKVSVLRYLWS